MHTNPHRRRRTKLLGSLVCYGVILGTLLLGWTYQQLPDVVYLEPGQKLSFPQLPGVGVRPPQGARSAAGARADDANQQLTLAGCIPLKTVRTIVTDRPVVQVSGQPFGIKMFSEGALVVAFSDVETETGRANPAKDAGVRLGDWIVKLGKEPIHSNQDLAQALQKVGGLSVTVTYQRDGVTGTAQLTPARDTDGRWRAGMWVRDSSAGVGTLTFVDEARGTFGGLGHPISDNDTGQSIALRSGEIVACTIVGCEKGKVGSPGELKGKFSGGLAIGTIRKNTGCGVFGTVRRRFAGEAFPVGFAQEVQPGPAEIVTTLSGKEPARYQVEIEKIQYRTEGKKHNLLLRVTDPALLAQTGGIVQGMSGSPIIQNGRLVGAVTHVLVNSPDKGYGIFIENMLEAAE